jgi:hypothetical protein
MGTMSATGNLEAERRTDSTSFARRVTPRLRAIFRSTRGIFAIIMEGASILRNMTLKTEGARLATDGERG